MSDFNQFNVEKMMSGDQREIRFLYLEMNPWLLHKTNNNEELSNDIFMKILDNLHKYDRNKSKFHNFIFTITKNEIYDYIRMIKRNKMKLQEVEGISKLADDKDNIIVYSGLDYLYFNSENYEYIETDFDEVIHEKDLQLNLIYKQMDVDDIQFVVNYLSEKKSKPMEDRKKYLRIIKKTKNKL